jgi:hypothetical protein
MALHPSTLTQLYSFNSDPNVPFSGHNEFIAATADPRYAEDPAFRDIVERRLAISDRETLGSKNYVSRPGWVLMVRDREDYEDVDELAPPNDRPQPAPQPFRNRDDVVQAMGDPKYRTDGDYRREVAARLSVSNIGIR